MSSRCAKPRARRDRGRPHSERGVTSIEGIVVASLVGLLLTISISSLRGAMAREETDGWARAMVRDISAGRQAALTRRETVRVLITGSDYTVATLGGVALRYAPLPADLVATTTCPSGVCAFNRRGIPLASGTITLSSTMTGRTFTITINAGTGTVSYSEI